MKRFTETNKWDDPWFWRLSPFAKILFLYLCDRCDPAGVVEVDLEMITARVGFPVTHGHLTELGDRVQKLSVGKYLLPKFIAFQYGTLSKNCIPHRKVFEALAKNALPQPTLCVGYTYPTCTQQEEEEREEEDKDKYNGGERPSLKEVLDHAQFIGGPAPWKARDWWQEMEGCGWLDHNKRPVAKWQAIFARVKSKWEADGRPMGPPAAKPVNGARAPTITELRTVLESKKAIADRIKNKFTVESATGLQWSNAEQRAAWQKARGEIKELEQRLANAA